MNEISDILKHFETVDLKAMDEVNLMDRTDSKYEFNKKDLPALLHKLQSRYKLLEINGNPIATYKTVYYDTEDLRLYMLHHRGANNRYKVRHRTYVDTKSGFLELKFTSNKGRTIKERIKQQEASADWSAEAYAFLSSHLSFDPNLLKISMGVNYHRITLLSKDTRERVTIDTDLVFVYGAEHKEIPNLVIAEVKQAQRERTPILTYLKEMGIASEPLSKYCLAVNTMRPEIKKNNFKEKLHLLSKLIYDTTPHASANI